MTPRFFSLRLFRRSSASSKCQGQHEKRQKRLRFFPSFDRLEERTPPTETIGTAVSLARVADAAILPHGRQMEMGHGSVAKPDLPAIVPAQRLPALGSGF